MDDYKDLDRAYTAALERIIMEAGLKFPSIYGYANLYTDKQIREHNNRVKAYRKNYEE